jgi:multidrug transporter EmrE-like cation transporter
MGYLFIVLTILLTVYGQIVVKWQVLNAGDLPGAPLDKVSFLFKLVINPWIISSFAAAFVAAISWMVAMTKYDLSYAYPFMSACFVLVAILSVLCFHEQITTFRIIGLTLIVLGMIISSK